MINELRIYWRLRPVIKQLKGLFAMRLSIQIIVQAVLLLMQGINQVMDLLPAKGKAVAMSLLLVCQTFIAIRNLWVNPDGTHATLPYTPPGVAKNGFKMPSILCAILLLPALARAADQGFTVGMAFDSNGSPQILGSGSYDKEIGMKIYSITGYDILPIKVEGKAIPQLKFTAFTGFLYDTITIGKLHFFLKGAGGVAATGDVTTGTGIYGGLFRYPIGKGWSVNAGGEGAYSPINGTDAIIRLGFRYGGF